MEHKNLELELVTKSGETKTFQSSPYSFFIEEQVLHARFGKEAFDKFQKTFSINFNLTSAQVEEDFKILINDAPSEIDIKHGDNYEKILDVYRFFLMYKSNAWVSHLTSGREALLSNLKTMEATLNSLPKDFLQILKSKITQN